MIKLFSLKQQKKEGESSKSSGAKRASAAQLRITKGQSNSSIKFLCFRLVNYQLHCLWFLPGSKNIYW